MADPGFLDGGGASLDRGGGARSDGTARAIWFPQSRKTDEIHGIPSRKQNPIKSNEICGIGNFLGFAYVQAT